MNSNRIFLRTPSQRWSLTLITLACFAWIGFAALRVNAATAAGSSIGNQASASYKDSTGTDRTATSNVAITIVQQVASLTLTADNVRIVAPGGQVTFPHTLVNTGNGTDTFNLAITQSGTDAFDLTGAAVYADANGDGIPDNATPISSSGTLPSGATFKFVVVGSVASSQTDGQTALIQIGATSVLNSSISAQNSDTARVSANAVINVTKAINADHGASPSGPYTYTLTYNNTGNSAATALILADIIPTGMTYAPGSARWSGSGATALTDAAGGDPAGIVYDFGLTQAGRVTAVIASVASGQSGTLTFQVNVEAGRAPGAINNTATYTYDPGTGTSVGPFNSNTALFTVDQVSSVTLSGQTIAVASQGTTIVFTNLVTNTGNGVDSFDVTVGASTFPAGTTFSLFQGDGTTPLLDSNNNGIPGTGPVPPGGVYTVILKATLPTTVSGGGPYSIEKTARSVTDPTQSAATTDTLTTITANTVDLTNDSSDASAPGAGPGPEVAAVTTIAVNPGNTARLTLYVRNTSAVADSYNLTGSTDANFTTLAFPAGWSLTFRDGSGAIITTTGVLAPGSSKLVYADISVPAGMAPGTYLGYFRALSPTTGAQDRKLDAVVVNTYRTLKLEPNNTGQVSPGGTVVYSHFISNEGNVVEGDGSTSTVLTTVDSASGFTSVTYWDQNNNGALDPTDPVVTDLSTMRNGINGASVSGGLDPGERARLFVKVFAPAGASAGTSDSTVLSAVTSGGVGTLPPAISVHDVTTVISGDVVLLKEQALDANGDGTPDGGYSTANITTGAIPGACIRYRITVTNNGSASATAVVLSDSTPAFTTYTATVPLATSLGSIVSSLTDGGTGTFQVNIGTLNPGQSAVVTFGVRINP